MDLTTFEWETARNRKAYQNLGDQIRRPYASQHIAFVAERACPFGEQCANIETSKTIEALALSYPPLLTGKESRPVNQTPRAATRPEPGRRFAGPQ
jgi:hypothetical protein